MYDGLSSSHKTRCAKILHFVRSPISMIASGYEYHRRCSESWTSVPLSERHLGKTDHQKRFGGQRGVAAVEAQLRVAVGESYCQALQQASLDDGISAEAVRTLSAGDGVGQMLHDIAALRGRTDLFGYTEACVDLISTAADDATAFNASWRRLASLAGVRGPQLPQLIDMLRHGSESSHVTRSGTNWTLRRAAERAWTAHRSAPTSRVPTSWQSLTALQLENVTTSLCADRP